MKMFDKETFHKMLSYAFLKIQAQNARKFDAPVCYSLYRFYKWTQQLCENISARSVASNKLFLCFFGFKT